MNFKHNSYHSSSFTASLVIILLGLTYNSLDSLKREHIHHIFSTSFINYPSFATLLLMLQTSYSSRSDSYFSIQDLADLIKFLIGQTSVALL